MWPEIEVVLEENRHELILHGNEISNRINSDGLDKNIFNLTSLNLLRISETSLDSIPDEISKLVNLQSLLFHCNKIQNITDKIDGLTKLKNLDLSNNEIITVPNSICKLHNITSMNIASNKLQMFPKLNEIVKLSVLDLSNNNLIEFPGICYPELTSLSEINLKSNEITLIPSEINKLSALKILNLSSNKINSIPGELADCTKLKDVNLKENPIQDKRLYKLIDQCRTKQVLDYVRQHCPRKGGKAPTGGSKKSAKKNRSELKSESENSLTNTLNDCQISDENVNGPKITVVKVTESDYIPNIQITEDVKKVRPFILACIVRNLKFDEQNFRKFIQIQTKLHETICEKRTAATIATHDYNKLFAQNIQPQDLLYTAKPPDELVIRPLGRGQLCTGTKLFQQLKIEAENLRREKKRNTYSGIHKYLHLLEGRSLFPCVCDNTGKVVSFPPITNSEDTRIGLETTDIFFEVTSAVGLEICRKTLNAILKETALLGLSDGPSPQNINVVRVKVVDLEGNLKNVYPSKIDLNFTSEDCVFVIRE